MKSRSQPVCTEQTVYVHTGRTLAKQLSNLEPFRQLYAGIEADIASSSEFSALSSPGAISLGALNAFFVQDGRFYVPINGLDGCYNSATLHPWTERTGANIGTLDGGQFYVSCQLPNVRGSYLSPSRWHWGAPPLTSSASLFVLVLILLAIVLLGPRAIVSIADALVRGIAAALFAARAAT